MSDELAKKLDILLEACDEGVARNPGELKSLLESLRRMGPLIKTAEEALQIRDQEFRGRALALDQRSAEVERRESALEESQKASLENVSADINTIKHATAQADLSLARVKATLGDVSKSVDKVSKETADGIVSRLDTPLREVFDGQNGLKAELTRCMGRVVLPGLKAISNVGGSIIKKQAETQAGLTDTIKDLLQQQDDLQVQVTATETRASKAESELVRSRASVNELEQQLGGCNRRLEQYIAGKQKSELDLALALKQEESLNTDLGRERSDLEAAKAELARVVKREKVLEEDLAKASERERCLRVDLGEAKVKLTEVVTREKGLKMDLEKNTADLAKVTKRAESLEAFLDRERNHLETTKEKLEGVTKRAESLQIDLGRERGELDEKKAELVGVANRVETLQTDLGRVRSDLDETKTTLAETNVSKSQLQSEKEVLVGELEQERAAVRKLVDEKGGLTSKLDGAQGQAELAAAFRSHISDLIGEPAAKETAERLQRELDSCQEALFAEETAHNETRANMESLNAKFKDVKANIIGAFKDRDAAREQVTMLEKAVEDLEEKSRSQQETLDGFEQTYKEQGESLTSARESLQSAQVERDAASFTAEAMKETIKDLQKERTDQATMLIEIKAGMASAYDERDDANDKVSRMEETIKDLQKEGAERAATLTNVRADLAVAKQEKDSANVEVARMEQTIKSLQKEGTQRVKALTDTRASLALAQQDKKAALAEASDLRKESTESGVKAASLQAAVEALQQKCLNMEAQIVSLEADAAQGRKRRREDEERPQEPKRPRLDVSVLSFQMAKVAEDLSDVHVFTRSTQETGRYAGLLLKEVYDGHRIQRLRKLNADGVVGSQHCLKGVLAGAPVHEGECRDQEDCQAVKIVLIKGQKMLRMK